MPETAIPTTAEEADARALAEKAGLEYRPPGAVAVDPRALAVLAPADCRRLGAVPLSASGTSVVVAIADTSAERREAVKAAATLEPRFVVIPKRTLDALLRSRMLLPAPRGGSRTAAPEAPPERLPEPERPPDPEPLPPAASAPASPPPEARQREPAVLDTRLVDAIVAALEPKLQALVERAPAPEARRQPARAPAPAPAPDPPAEVPATIAELVAQADASIAAWSSVRASLVALGEEVDASRQNLRDAKERLSVAHADNDQHQRRIHALETEIEDRQSLVEETRARLQDAADALGNYARRLESTEEVI
jgi:hypothetical protein